MSRQDNEREAARVTIVGGQPPGNARAIDDALPVALEQLLKMAAVDEAFRAALLTDWRQTVEAAGLTVVPTEARILEVVEADQLRRMIEQVEKRLAGEERRGFLAAAAAAVLGLAGGSAVLASGCRTAPQPPLQPQPQRGVRPDRPPPPPPPRNGPVPAGIRPRRTPVPAGIQPMPRPPQRVQPTAGATPELQPRFSGAGASSQGPYRGRPNAGMAVSPRRRPPDAGPPDAGSKPPPRRIPPKAGIPPDRHRPRTNAGVRARDKDD